MPEVIIYHHTYDQKSGTSYLNPIILAPEVPPVPEKPQKKNINIFSGMAKISALIGIALILVTYAPPAFAWSSNLIQSNLPNYKPTTAEMKFSGIAQTKPEYIPPLDASLPKENTLIIPAIGVRTVLQEATLDNYEAALRKGVWRVSDFGAPDDRSRPTILAAHRYGYLAWTAEYRRENSFFNLPKLKVGDTVEIDYGQRKYSYEIYAQGTGTEITDYSADLILYTCQNLTGDVRIFEYAKLIIL